MSETIKRAMETARWSSRVASAERRELHAKVGEFGTAWESPM